MSIINLIIVCLEHAALFGPFVVLTPRADEALLQQYSLPTDSRSLIRYLDAASGSVSGEDVLRLIDGLGSDDFQEREGALDQLVATGTAALPELKTAIKNSPKPEVRARARAAVDRIHLSGDLPAGAAAVRLLHARRRDGALEAILRYLPSADRATQVEAFLAIRALARGPRGVHQSILQALSDPSPTRRAVAAWVVGLDGTQKERELARGCLKDDVDEVRLRAAQGLLGGRDSAAVPALVTLLTSTRTIALQAEELLRCIAGRAAPTQTLANGAGRANCQAAWSEWWAKAKRVDWSSASGRCPCLVFVGVGTRGENGARLYGSDGAVRLELAGEKLPGVLSWLPDEEGFACVEGAGGETRVVRRDLSGRETWRSPAVGAEIWALDRAPGGELLLLLSRGAFVAVNERGTVHVVRPALRDGFRRPGQQFILDRERIVGLSQNGWAPTPRIEWMNAGRGTVYQRFELPPNRDRERLRVWNGCRGLTIVHAPPNERESESRTTPLTVIGSDARTGKSVVSPVWPVARPSLLPSGSALIIGRPLLGNFWNAHVVVELDRFGRSVWEVVYPKPIPWVEDAFPLLRLGFDAPRANLDTWAERRRQLDSADESVRRYAAIRLCLTAPSDEELTDAILETVGADENVRRALYELARATERVIGERAVASLIRHLGESGEPELLLARMKEPARVALLGVVADRASPSRQRASAARCLGRWLDQADVKAALRAALADPQRDVRTAAVFGICEQDARAVDWVPALAKLVQDPDRAFAGDVLVILGSLQAAPEEVVPVLTAALRQTDLRPGALRGLARVAERDPSQILSDKEAIEALLGLTEMGGNAQEIVCSGLQLLTTVYAHPKAVRHSPEAFIRKLRDLLADHKSEKITETILQNALTALTEFGPRAVAARADILIVLAEQKHGAETRVRAFKAVVAVGPLDGDAKRAVKRIAESENEDPKLRGLCRDFLRKSP